MHRLHALLVRVIPLVAAPLAFSLSVPSASAQLPGDQGAVRVNVELARRVSELEEQVRTLQARIRDLEQRAPANERRSADPRGSSSRRGVDDSRVALSQRSFDEAVVPGQAGSERPEMRAPSETRSCNEPTFLDPRGVRRIRPECMRAASANPCESPFMVDMQGIKRVKTSCLRALASR